MSFTNRDGRVDSCRTAQEKMDFTISAHHYNGTPSEIVSFLNDANEDESAVIPDFVASKEQIAITGEDGTLGAYLTFTTDESGYTTVSRGSGKRESLSELTIHRDTGR